MMRATLLVLLLANAGYFTWTQGHWSALAGAGSWADPAPLREPQRLAQQRQPERVAVWRTATEPAAGPPSASGTSRRGTETLPCLQATALSDPHVAGLQAALARALPDGSWQIDTTALPARWIVYLGKFPTSEALRARKADLRAAKVEHRDVNHPALQPGLALGTFPSEATAAQALRDVARNGIKNAKVVIERPETRQHTLTLPQATPALQDTVRGLNSGLADAPSLDWQTCPG